MKYTIVIKKGKKELDKIVVDDYYLILSNPGKFEGLKMIPSTKSIPRQMGWIEWVRGVLKRKQDVCLDYSYNHQVKFVSQSKKLKNKGRTKQNKKDKKYV